jgi:hypothetical protein
MNLSLRVLAFASLGCRLGPQMLTPTHKRAVSGLVIQCMQHYISFRSRIFTRTSATSVKSVLFLCQISRSFLFGYSSVERPLARPSAPFKQRPRSTRESCDPLLNDVQ